jgi:hypothetical protein
MTEDNQAARTEAIQAVVDRISSYQDGASEGTVETELRSGLEEAGLSLEDRDVVTLAQALQSEHGNVDVASVLGR